MTAPHIIDRWTREGHSRFMDDLRFYRVGNQPVTMTFAEWVAWQQTRDPLADDPATAAKVRKRLDAEHLRLVPGTYSTPRARKAAKA